MPQAGEMLVEAILTSCLPSPMISPARGTRCCCPVFCNALAHHKRRTNNLKTIHLYMLVVQRSLQSCRGRFGVANQYCYHSEDVVLTCAGSNNNNNNNGCPIPFLECYFVVECLRSVILLRVNPCWHLSSRSAQVNCLSRHCSRIQTHIFCARLWKKLLH